MSNMSDVCLDSSGSSNEASPPPSGDAQWCCTQSKVYNLNIMWTINNFSFCHKEVGESINSSLFSNEVDEKLKWHLQIFPKGTREKFRNCLSLYLHCSAEVIAKYKMYILNAKGQKTNILESLKTKKFAPGYGEGLEDYIRQELLFRKCNGLLRDDKLTICAEISVVSDVVNTTRDIDAAMEVKVPECRLSEDLGNLLESRKFSDVSLEVGGEELHAHIAILAARSEVFAAMFEHEMEERKSNRVVIQDADVEVFKEMLKFIYTGKAPKLHEIADELLTLADRYALEKLKAMCEESLYVHLTVENAVKTLIYADLHNARQLKTQTIEFIKNFANEVIETPGWQNMMRTHSYLGTEVLQTYINNQAPQVHFPKTRRCL